MSQVEMRIKSVATARLLHGESATLLEAVHAAIDLEDDVSTQTSDNVIEWAQRAQNF